MTGLDFVNRVVERPREPELLAVLHTLLRSESKFATYRCILPGSPLHFPRMQDSPTTARALRRGCQILLAYDLVTCRSSSRRHEDYVVTSKWHAIRDALGSALALLKASPTL